MIVSHLRLTAIAVATGIALPAQNLVLDGDLEGHTAGPGCHVNLAEPQFNGFYANVTAFVRSSLPPSWQRSTGIDILDASCPWGSAPQSGATKLALAFNGKPSGDVDSLALALATPLTAGRVYHGSFWAEHLPFGREATFEIGVSTSPTAFGTRVFAATPGQGWSRFRFTFVAPEAATHLTAQCVFGVQNWVAVDNFSLQAGAMPASNMPIGQGCHGLGLAALSTPRIGSDWNLDLTGVPAGALASFLLLDVIDPGLSLAPLGAASCTLYSGGLVVIPLGARPSSPALTIPIPLRRRLVGAPLYAQGGALVPGINRLGIAFTNGVKGVIGDL